MFTKTRKFLVSLLVMFFAFGVAGSTVFASDEPTGRIEITFRVGDNVLNINGNPVEVEPPYIVDGVTLVPVRVITEAFGADVEWVGETREVILTYRDVEIILQIDNINANVNGQMQTLLFQPQLTNSVTMVPLRFIAENFGADVDWDDDTREITVVKEVFDGGALDDIEDVLRRSNMPMMGDSFLGWSIRRTPDMEVEFRSFDGRLNTFGISRDAYIEIDFFNNIGEETFATIRADEMEMARRNTPIGQHVRRTTSGAEFVVTQFRNRFDFIERRVFLRPGNQIVEVMLTIDSSVGTAARNEYIAILDTFDFVFNAAETEDLSNVLNGMRLFDNRELGIQFRVPAEWLEIPSPDRMNYFMFGNIYDEGVFAGASLEVVSVQAGDNAGRWASEALAQDRRTYNPSFSTFGILQTMNVGGVMATYYQSQRTMFGLELTSRRIFWEYEGYLYNLYITVRRNNVATMQRIIDSVSFEAIDREAVGTLLREPIEREIAFSTVRNTNLGFTMDVPVAWSRFLDSMFSDTRTGISVIVMRSNETITLEETREMLSEVGEQLDLTIVRAPIAIPRANLSSNALSGFMFEARGPASFGAGANYIMQYTINSGNQAFVITVTIPEMFSSEANRATINRMIGSFALN